VADVTLISHTCGITHMHLELTHPQIPIIEYFPLLCRDTMPEVDTTAVFLDEPQPDGASVTFPSRRELGDEVNPAGFG